MSSNTPVLSDPITLDEPIVRGDQTIQFIRLRRPNAGELRGGIKVLNLAQLDVDSLHVLLPRITEPPLTEGEIATLSFSDFFQLSAEVGNFLLPKEARVDSLPQ